MEAAPTTAAWRALRDDDAPPSPALVDTTRRIADDHGFFHWELAFPQVFARGGFDVVLGNPALGAGQAPGAGVLRHARPGDRERAERRRAEEAHRGASLHRPGPLAGVDRREPASRRGRATSCGSPAATRSAGKGDVNTYALFAEHNWRVLAPRGRAGFIVPSGIATDDTTKAYFQAIMKSHALRIDVGVRERGLLYGRQGAHASLFVDDPLGQERSAGVSRLPVSGAGACGPRRRGTPLHPGRRRRRGPQSEHGNLPDLPHEAGRRARARAPPALRSALARRGPGRESLGRCGS